MALHFPLQQIQLILDRIPRPLDPLEQQARAHLAGLAQEEADRLWEGVCMRVLLNPVYLGFLWPETCGQHPELQTLTRNLLTQMWVPALMSEVQTSSAQWVIEQGDAEIPGTLMHDLLNDLATFPISADKNFAFLARYYTWRDVLVTQLVAPERMELLDRIFALLHMQVQQWGKPYCSGYAYQGYEPIGLAGVKPTQERLAGYGFLPWLHKGMSVLEVGCNNGFMALELARQAGRVDAVEYNPFLVEIGRITAAAVGQHNVHYQVADFTTWQPHQRYDVVLSFANHCTIDGNLSVEFESFVAKLWQITADDGWLLFESHNVFGPGTGAPGDDGDLDAKFEVMERYFELVDSKMTKAFVPNQDIDKLFVALRRRPAVLASVTRQMNLALARTRYEYRGTPFA
jgi:SAM-dependent methyltransferase